MRKRHDRYFKKAKQAGYLARSIYKLEEIDRRHGILKSGDSVLDLGAAPGSWLEYILETIGERGRACAVDRQTIDRKFKGRVTFCKSDVHDLPHDAFARVAETFGAVVSDMAPNTSGVKTVDQARSLELAEAAADYAAAVLRPGGNFVCKVLEGPELPAFRQRLAEQFATVKVTKPDASRDESMETFVVCLGWRGSRGARSKPGI